MRPDPAAGRCRRIIVVAALAVLLASCDGSDSRHTRYQIGDALRQYPNLATVGYHKLAAHQVVFVPLSGFENKSAEPVRLLATRLLDVPTTIKIINYRAYTYEETNGEIFGWRGGEPRTDPRRFRSKPVNGLVIAPHAQPDFYILAEVIPKAKGTFALRDCEIRYMRPGHPYSQIVDEVTNKLYVTH